VGLLGGCAKAPDQELAAAKSALQAAQTAEADVNLIDSLMGLFITLTIRIY
jgi:hypothetical protein